MNADYVNDLNESQRAAVVYTDGPSLVIAGAGSGKTRVLTYKIAYLLDNGYEPWSILALTFTNKASREMKERIAKQVGIKRTQGLWMGTFHSVFSRILRAEAALLNFPSQFTIYDASDSKSLVRSIIKEMQLDEKTYKYGTVLARISQAKNHLVTPDQYARTNEAIQDDFAKRMPAISDIYKRYWERCRQAGAMDFDDLLLYTYLLFKENPEVLQRYSDLFRYILVDEYQDTNYAQHCIIQLLAQRHGRICVVGDDAQSIYSFRGADIDNILYFTKQYAGTKIFKLEQNYRSTQLIVQAANSLIEKNTRQIRKNVFSENAEGELLPVMQAYSDVEEGEMVVNSLQGLRRKHGYEFSDFAVLYRTNAQSRIFEEALRKRAIPYRIYGGLSFYQRKEIKDVIAYFRLVINPDDEEALKRVINYPARGIGNTTIGKVVEAATSNNISLWSVLCETQQYLHSVNKGTITKLMGFKNLIDGFIARSDESAYTLGLDIVRGSGIMNDVCQDNSPENLSRKENIEELMNAVEAFCATRQEEGGTITLADFLSEISLLTDADTEGEAEEDTPKVTLMTVHSAKGLEFKNVFVVGLEENLFPSNMGGESPRALEEERRLFYVAITRAEEHCYLSYAKTRFRYGKMEFGAPSRFLRDINPSYLQLPRELNTAMPREKRNFETPYAQPRPQQDRFVKPAAPMHLRAMRDVVHTSASPKSGVQNTLEVGQRVEHERFGVGEVIGVDGVGENAKATIKFQNAGVKQLLLRFARFKKIG